MLLKFYSWWRAVPCDLCKNTTDTAGMFVWETHRFAKVVCRPCADYLPPGMEIRQMRDMIAAEYEG